MLELTIYGLIWLAAMLLIAFWFAYADEFSSPQEKSSFDLVNDAPRRILRGLRSRWRTDSPRGRLSSLPLVARPWRGLQSPDQQRKCSAKKTFGLGLDKRSTSGVTHSYTEAQEKTKGIGDRNVVCQLPTHCQCRTSQ